MTPMTNTTTSAKMYAYRVTCCGTYIDEAIATSPARAIAIVARRYPRLVRSMLTAREC